MSIRAEMTAGAEHACKQIRGSVGHTELIEEVPLHRHENSKTDDLHRSVERTQVRLDGSQRA